MKLTKQARNVVSQSIRYLRISYMEAKSSQAGAYLGILWIPLSSILFSVTLATVFKHSDKISILEFCLYVLSGYTLWSFISDLINSSVDVMQTKWDFAIHNRLGLFGLFAKQMSDKILEYVLNLFGIFVVMIVVAPNNIGPNILLFIIVLLIMATTYIPAAYLINVLTIFYPDLKALIRVASRFLFFISPVFWMADGKSNSMREVLVHYNPISYYLSLPRQAVGVEPFSLSVWVVAISVTCFIILSGSIVYYYTHKFIRNLK